MEVVWGTGWVSLETVLLTIVRRHAGGLETNGLLPITVELLRRAERSIAFHFFTELKFLQWISRVGVAGVTHGLQNCAQ